MEKSELLNLTADIVSAHVGHNSVALGDVANLVQRVHSALAGLSAPEAPAEPEAKTAVVSIRASIRPDYLICMECGKKQKTLKRHLSSAHAMTPAQYRSDYGLPKDYPMTSANYSKQRGEMARAIGLGRKPAEGTSTAKPKAKSVRAKLGLRRAPTAKGQTAREESGSVPQPQADNE